MKVHFEGKNKTFFPAYKLTLVPGENTIPDDIGKALVEANAVECKRGKGKNEKPRLTEVVAKPVASSTSKPPLFSKPPKKGAK